MLLVLPPGTIFEEEIAFPGGELSFILPRSQLMLMMQAVVIVLLASNQPEELLGDLIANVLLQK
mgnify:FL=1